jgi:nitrous oxidase accessory protein NosD
MAFFSLSLVLLLFAKSAFTINVKNAAELTSALNKAQGGDVIKLADGTYEGQFKASQSGTSSNKITLEGSKKAILTSGSKGQAFHLTGDHWILNG